MKIKLVIFSIFVSMAASAADFTIQVNPANTSVGVPQLKTGLAPLACQVGEQLKWNSSSQIWFCKASGVSVKTSAYTITDLDDIVLCDTTAGDFTVTLPPAISSNIGKKLVIKKKDTSGNRVTVDANASELIDGTLTRKVGAPNDSIEIISDGTGWVVLKSEAVAISTTASNINVVLSSTNTHTILWALPSVDTHGVITAAGNQGISAPVAGLYEISVDIVTEGNGTQGTYQPFITKNTADIKRTYYNPYSNTQYVTTSVSTITRLAVGEQIGARFFISNASTNFRLAYLDMKRIGD